MKIVKMYLEIIGMGVFGALLMRYGSPGSPEWAQGLAGWVAVCAYACRVRA